MAIVAHALTTLASVKEFIGITGSSDDALLETLIDNITEFVEGQMGGRRIKLTSYVDELHDGGEKDIFMFNFPIVTPPTLTAEFKRGNEETPDFTLFQVNDFTVYFQAGFVHFFGRTFHGSQNLQFTYDAGFADIPNDIELLAKQLVAEAFKKRNAQGIKKETVEGSSIEYFSASEENLTAEQKAVILRYRRTPLGENL